MVMPCWANLRDLALILKFKSANIGYQDQTFKINNIHTKVPISSLILLHLFLVICFENYLYRKCYQDFHI